MNNWRLHLDQEVACWVQRKSLWGMMRSSLSDWWMGLVEEIRVLGGSVKRTDSVGAVHQQPYLMELAGRG